MRSIIIAALAASLLASPAAAQSYAETLLVHHNEVRKWEADMRDYVTAIADWERATKQRMADDQLRPVCEIVARHRVQRRMNNVLAGLPSLQLNQPYTVSLVGTALTESFKERKAARRCDAVSAGS